MGVTVMAQLVYICSGRFFSRYEQRKDTIIKTMVKLNYNPAFLAPCYIAVQLHGKLICSNTVFKST